MQNVKSISGLPFARIIENRQTKRVGWAWQFLRARCAASLLGLELGNEGVPKNNFLGQKARTAGAKLAAPPALGDAAPPIERYAPRPLNSAAPWRVAAQDASGRSGLHPPADRPQNRCKSLRARERS
jgi:hypothetical protein